MIYVRNITAKCYIPQISILLGWKQCLVLELCYLLKPICCRRWHLIRVYTVCYSSSWLLTTQHVVKWSYLNFKTSMVLRSLDRNLNTLSYKPKIWLTVGVSKKSSMSGKQCRLWSDATLCSIWSGSTLFVQACLSEDFCSGLSVQILLVNTVYRAQKNKKNKDHR